jgi:hypothetical protein
MLMFATLLWNCLLAQKKICAALDYSALRLFACTKNCVGSDYSVLGLFACKKKSVGLER